MTPEGKFLSEVIRPIAEKMRALDYEIQAALTEWWGSKMNEAIKNDATAYDDGRVDQGVAAVRGSEISNIITQMAEYKALMDRAGVRDTIQKPCVRPLRVE